jgi:RecJ-like exonuclease
MDAQTLCQHCEGRPAIHDCDRCGTVVCRLHYDSEMRFCADCAAKAKPDGRRGDTFRY